MSLTHQLTDYTNAAFTGIWLHTLEPDEVEREIIRHAQQQKWRLAVCDLANHQRQEFLGGVQVALIDGLEYLGYVGHA